MSEERSDDPIEDTRDTFLGLLECFGLKQPDEIECHPLNFKHLLKSQEKDKTLLKILAMPNTKYELQDFHGGGKTTALLCYRNKIVVPKKYKNQSYTGTIQLSVTLAEPEQKKPLDNIYGGQIWEITLQIM
jgi:hypothetical protein